MKKKKLIPVKVYFSDEAFVKRLENIARVTGFSLSGVTALAVKQGIAQVEEMFIEPSQVKEKEVTKK
jgi:intergrase/recombinase